MKHLIILITCFFIYFSLLSCVGVETSNISTTPTVTFTNTIIATITTTLTPAPLSTNSEVVASSTLEPGSVIAIIQSDDPNSTPQLIRVPDPNATPTLSPREQTAVTTALDFMGDNADNLKLTKIHSGNPQIVDFQQTYRGIPVAGAYISVYIYPNKPPTSPDEFRVNVELPSITPTITLSEAIAITAKQANIKGDYTLTEHSLLVYSIPYEGKGQKYVLAWKVALRAKCPKGTWLAYTNAYTGNVLSFGEGGIPPKIPYRRTADCPEPPRVPKPTPIPAP